MLYYSSVLSSLAGRAVTRPVKLPVPSREHSYPDWVSGFPREEEAQSIAYGRKLVISGGAHEAASLMVLPDETLFPLSSGLVCEHSAADTIHPQLEDLFRPFANNARFGLESPPALTQTTSSTRSLSPTSTIHA